MLNGLTTVNVELTSRCNKTCWMCGRRKIERDYPELAKWGDMPFDMVEDIAAQLPEGIVVQFHNNGEPLLYPAFGNAVKLFSKQIRCMDTNGKLLVEKADQIIDNLDTITVSVIENDPEAAEQQKVLREFMYIKGTRKPKVIARILGIRSYVPFDKMGCLIAHRTIHDPMGSYKYRKPPTIPEIGICLDALNHLAIDRNGYVNMCVRFDPHHEGVIGNIGEQSLINIWNGDLRKMMLYNHIEGHRERNPLCAECRYWGCPNG